MSFDELRDKMAAMMGGRAAEELFIGEISTGASNDLRQATELAKLMVRDYGMSRELGPGGLANPPSPGGGAGGAAADHRGGGGARAGTHPGAEGDLRLTRDRVGCGTSLG
jgi:cell division protease FtsH